MAGGDAGGGDGLAGRLAAGHLQVQRQELGEPVKELVKDVPVLTRANVPHWHGAAPDSHVVQLTIYGGDIKWGAPVTDAEYLGKKR